MKKYETIQWLWQRIAYWGDKLLTLVYLVLFGLFILGYRFINMVRIKAWNTFLYVMRGTRSAWRDWRMGRRIKNDFKNYGLRRIADETGIPEKRLRGTKSGLMTGSEEGEGKEL